MASKCLAMPSLPGPGKQGRHKECSLDDVSDDMCANGLTAKDADKQAKWNRWSRTCKGKSLSIRSNNKISRK